MKAAKDTGLDPILLAVLIFLESGGDSEAISSAGAVGLMQIMPRDGIASSFMCINGPCFANRPTTEELRDPAYNIKYGSKLLAGLVNEYGLREALFRYGPSGVGYEGYADKIIDLAKRIRK